MTWLEIAFISAVLSAAAAVIQKKILFKVDAVAFSFVLSAVIMIFSIGILFVADVSRVSTEALTVLVVKGVINAFAFVLVMMMLEKSEISGSLPLMGLTPGVTAILAFALIGDAINVKEIAGLLLMTGGIFVLEMRGNGLIISRVAWYVVGALSLFSVSAVLDKLLLSGYKVEPLVVLFYQHAIFLVVFLILLVMRHRSFTLPSINWNSFLPIIVVALLTFGYRIAQLEAVKIGPVALVLAVKRTSILLASFAGGKFFNEKRLAPRVAGAALIVAAGFMILRNVG